MNEQTSSPKSTRAYQAVYTIVEAKDGREHWVRIGAAFENRDSSLTIRLDALPLGRKLVVRKPRDPRSSARVVRVHGTEPLG